MISFSSRIGIHFFYICVHVRVGTGLRAGGYYSFVAPKVAPSFWWASRPFCVFLCGEDWRGASLSLLHTNKVFVNLNEVFKYLNKAFTEFN